MSPHPFAWNGWKQFDELFLFAFVHEERQLGSCQEAKGLRSLSSRHLDWRLPQLSSLGDKAGIYPTIYNVQQIMQSIFDQLNLPKIQKHSNIVEVAAIPPDCLLLVDTFDINEKKIKMENISMLLCSKCTETWAKTFKLVISCSRRSQNSLARGCLSPEYMSRSPVSDIFIVDWMDVPVIFV